MNAIMQSTVADLPPVFSNDWVEINGIEVCLDSWASEAERRYYRGRAEKLLGFYRYDLAELQRVQVELKNWTELRWEDVFRPGDVLRGVSYDKDRVQSSNISDEPYQVYAAAESKLERNRREREHLVREESEWQKRVDNGLRLLDLLRGTTREVARYLWFDAQEMTYEEIEKRVDRCHATVANERNKAIEAVALFLKRSDYRKVRMWFM